MIRGKGVATCEIMGGVGLFLCPMIVYLVGNPKSMSKCSEVHGYVGTIKLTDSY